MTGTRMASILRVALMVVLLAPGLAEARGRERGDRGRTSVPEFDPATIGVVAALVAGGGVLLARRRRR